MTIGGTTVTDVEGALSGLNTAKVEIIQGAANAGKTLVVDSSGNLVLGDMEDSNIIVGHSDYPANPTVNTLPVSMDLSDGKYTLDYYATDNNMTVKREETTYSTGVIQVVYRKKPTASGTLYVVARKVGNN